MSKLEYEKLLHIYLISISIITTAAVCSLIAVYSMHPTIQQALALTPGSANTTTITTPIKHLLVIYLENIAFDHYFATYPNAENLPDEPHFSALPNTPSINGLTIGLLNNNTNLINPFRLDREDSKIVAICDNNHELSAIQKAYNGGLLNKFR